MTRGKPAEAVVRAAPDRPFYVAEVSADKAYLSHARHRMVPRYRALQLTARAG